MSAELQTIVFALGMGMAAAGLVLSVCGLAADVIAWMRDRAEDKKKPPETE